MILRTANIRASRQLLIASLISFASFANAGPSTVTPALAACSKALIETLARTETLPAYTVRAPSVFVSELVDRNAFTVTARHKKTNQLLAKAACKATPAGEIVSFRSIPVKS